MADTVVKDNIRYWSDLEGAVFWGPLGTPLPETPFEELNEAFEAIGALTEDGPSEGVSVDVEKLKIWPGGQTARVKTTGTEKTFAFTAVEEKPVVTKLFWDAGAITVSGTGETQFAEYDIPESFGTVEGAMVAVFRDGDNIKVRKMEKCQVSDRGDVSNGTSDPTSYELTVDVIGKDSVMTTSAAFLEAAPETEPDESSSSS